MQRAALGEEVMDYEFEWRFPDGESRSLYGNAMPLRDESGNTVGGVAAFIDITERKRQEERVSLLMREVNHRAKNMLALVQAIARQTVAINPEDFVARFGERISALAASQDLLVRSEWRGADFHELVRSQLAHFSDLIGSRIEPMGPSLFISASAAQTMAWLCTS